MKHLLSSAGLVLLLSLFHTATILAVTLDTIGSSATTNGDPGSTWYYTSENPLLTGTAAANSSVTVAIDGTDYPVTADASGNWSLVPTTLTDGAHSVTVTGDGQTLSFTLNIGQSVPTQSSTPSAQASGSATTLPVSGTLENTLFLFGAGSIFVGGGWWLSKRA